MTPFCSLVQATLKKKNMSQPFADSLIANQSVRGSFQQMRPLQALSWPRMLQH
jgi:hypothetical protein